MKGFVKEFSLRLACVALAIVVSGCGSSSSVNNDQGAAFRAIAYQAFGQSPGSDSSSSSSNNEQEYISSASMSLPDGVGKLSVIMLVQNNTTRPLTSEAVYCCAFVVGSPLQYCYSHSVGVAIPAGKTESINPQTGAASVSGTAITSSNNNSSSNNTGNSRAQIGFPIYSPSLADYLGVNKNHLPKEPWELVINCETAARTQSGLEIRTNELPFQITVMKNRPDMANVSISTETQTNNNISSFTTSGSTANNNNTNTNTNTSGNSSNNNNANTSGNSSNNNIDTSGNSNNNNADNLNQ